jgi:hypothetical protein
MTTMTSTVPAAEVRRQAAESRLLVIKNALEVADQELSRALAERDWEARTRALIEADPSVTEREIAAATGASPATAHRDVLAVTGRQPASNEAKPEPVQATPPPPQSGYRAAVALVAARGAAGMTFVELCDATGWRGGQATGALSKATSKKLLRSTGLFRDGCGVYVAC